jgi:acetyl esterase/lipase
VHDLKCAVRWLRENAPKYNIDKNRIGAVGVSSGGTLALMLGLTDTSDGLEGDCGDSGISSRIQAAVNLAGGTDMVAHYEVRSGYIGPYLGSSPEEAPQRYKAASPVTYVSADDPPVLTLCGTRDPSLPQVTLFDEKMIMIGATHTLIVKEGAGHGIYALVSFYEDNPVWDFFDTHLKQVE